MCEGVDSKCSSGVSIDTLARVSLRSSFGTNTETPDCGAVLSSDGKQSVVSHQRSADWLSVDQLKTDCDAPLKGGASFVL